ncbi:NIPSNAP family protein [Azospirillum endophyticum]
MLFERRCYTFKPGLIETFWEYQRRWNSPAHIPHLLERNVGYFETVAGPAEQIIMFYRYDSFDDWRTRLFGNIDDERNEYLVAGRRLMLAQENMFLTVSPIDALNPIWGQERDWLPGRPVFQVDRPDALRLTEEVVDFRPGGLQSYWEAYRAYLDEEHAIATSRLVGCFVSLVGQQHRVIHYRWFDDLSDAAAFPLAQQETEAWRRFAGGFREHVAQSHVRFLKPARVPWMRALFEAVPDSGDSGTPGR